MVLISTKNTYDVYVGFFIRSYLHLNSSLDGCVFDMLIYSSWNREQVPFRDVMKTAAAVEW